MAAGNLHHLQRMCEITRFQAQNNCSSTTIQFQLRQHQDGVEQNLKQMKQYIVYIYIRYISIENGYSDNTDNKWHHMASHGPRAALGVLCCLCVLHLRTLVTFVRDPVKVSQIQPQSPCKDS